ncbi:MAG: cysteine--tRNA ligase [Thermoguttaceae bacterium]|jgi:cysteinyl-tRNA synthetase|nr:cysteine--tRNA ligase [Thermoguttaceae bacterium]
MPPRKVNSILELIGNTPLIRINRLNPEPGVEVFVKLESMNPGGSVKDRIALRMIEQAEATGQLTRDKIVLEASSGNTAIGLAMVCAVKGYRLLVTMSESASEERRRILRAYGAQIVLTPGYQGTDGAIEEAYRLAREEPDKYMLVDQFNNDANWLAHYEGTGREIVEATEGKVDVVVLTMGTTGTLMGTARALRELVPTVRVVGVEPYKGHKIQGLKNLKESYPPGIFNPEVPHALVNVDDDSAYEMARRLAREEGIFVGMSAGAAMKVALDEAKALGRGVVVALLPDGGERYLSTSLFASEVVPEPLHFHNTLSGKIERLEPTNPRRVTVYSCGPSLDGPPDLALCRRLVFSDVLRRYLECRGYEVKHAMNLGDIDDRVVNECLKTQGRLREFTARWEKVFFEALATLRVRRAEHYPRASEHVGDMIELTRRLLEKGLAYEKLRSVYYRIDRFPEYGRLSKVPPGQVRAESPTLYDYYEKDNPRDFALFKRSTLAELKAGIFWDTPWGKARPGWHIECSCMAVRCLGQPFDIHTASTDLTFPHGDNEIAIACGLAGKPLAKLWMHCEVVMADGKKVSRAAGNDVTLEDLLAEGFDGATIRYWLLAAHYRTPLHYHRAELQSAQRCVARLNEFATRLRQFEGGRHAADLDQALYEARAGWQEAMDRDLNTPTALGRVFAFIRRCNRLLDQHGMDCQQSQQVLEFLGQVNRVLAVIDTPSDQSDAEVERLVAARNQARRAGDFHRADLIREELRAKGIHLIDSPTGTRWRR